MTEVLGQVISFLLEIMQWYDPTKCDSLLRFWRSIRHQDHSSYKLKEEELFVATQDATKTKSELPRRGTAEHQEASPDELDAALPTGNSTEATMESTQPSTVAGRPTFKRTRSGRQSRPPERLDL